MHSALQTLQSMECSALNTEYSAQDEDSTEMMARDWMCLPTVGMSPLVGFIKTMRHQHDDIVEGLQIEVA